MIIKKLSLDEWKNSMMESCYFESFNGERAKELEKCSFVLTVLDGERLVGWITCLEMDGETCYWQFGGAMEASKKSYEIVMAYMLCIKWAKEHYKCITTRIENTNIPMLKMALTCGFLVNGIFFNEQLFLELILDFGGKP